MQALFFYLPSVVWHGLNSKAGVDSDNILAAANLLTQTKTPEKREKVYNTDWQGIWQPADKETHLENTSHAMKYQSDTDTD